MLSDQQLEALAEGTSEDAAKLAIVPPEAVDVTPPPKTTEQLMKDAQLEFQAQQQIREVKKQQRFLAARKEALSMPFTASAIQSFALQCHNAAKDDAILDVETQVRVSAAQGAQRITFKTVGEKEPKDWNHQALVDHFNTLGFKIEEIEDGFVVVFSKE